MSSVQLILVGFFSLRFTFAMDVSDSGSAPVWLVLGGRRGGGWVISAGNPEMALRRPAGVARRCPQAAAVENYGI